MGASQGWVWAGGLTEWGSRDREVQISADAEEHVTNESHTLWECRSLSYFENTALFPLTDLFQRLLRFQAEETPDEKLGKLEQTMSQYRLPLEESVPLFAPLLSLSVPENRYPLLNLSPQRQRQKTLETSSPSSWNLLNINLSSLSWKTCIGQTPPPWSCLVCCRADTHRVSVRAPHLPPPFSASWHHRCYMTEMTLQPLITHPGGTNCHMRDRWQNLPSRGAPQIVEKTDGVPLFVEEMTKAILESGHLKDIDGHYELTGSLSR